MVAGFNLALHDPEESNYIHKKAFQSPNFNSILTFRCYHHNKDIRCKKFCTAIKHQLM